MIELPKTRVTAEGMVERHNMPAVAKLLGQLAEYGFRARLEEIWRPGISPSILIELVEWPYGKNPLPPTPAITRSSIEDFVKSGIAEGSFSAAAGFSVYSAIETHVWRHHKPRHYRSDTPICGCPLNEVEGEYARGIQPFSFLAFSKLEPADMRVVEGLGPGRIKAVKVMGQQLERDMADLLEAMAEPLPTLE